MCFWDRLPQSQLLVTVVAHDVGIIFQNSCVSQISSEGFRTTITQLPSRIQPLTISLPLGMLSSDHLKLPAFGCTIQFSPIHKNFHYSMDCRNSVFTYLMGFRCELFIDFPLRRLRHFLISKGALLLLNSLSIII
jgi:hypothetical protein